MRKLIWICSVLIFLVACGDEAEPVPEETGLSTWLPEWDEEAAVSDILALENKFDTIRLFAANYNEDDEIQLPKRLTDSLETLRENDLDDRHMVLSITNDWIPENGESIAKETDLIHRLIETEKKQKVHTAEIVDLAKEVDVPEIELNFEQIDEADIDVFVDFIELLQAELDAEGVRLSVVLEPYFPFDTALPDGPEYIVMAYDVFGAHSGPGPKATFEFLDELDENLQASNQAVQIAFATDGFQWDKDDVATAVSEKYAAGEAVDEVRDENSGALSYQYEMDDEKYQVWYADDETISGWIEYMEAKDKGYEHFLLWRAGGWSDDMKNWIKQ